MLIHDLSLLLFAYLVLVLLQAMALPLIFYVSQRFPYIHDAGWGFGRLLSLLLVAVLTWHLAFLKIPINTQLGVNALFFGLMAASTFFAWRYFLRQPGFLKRFFTRFGRIIGIEELVFIAALLFLFAMRSFQPEILGLEKFMDAGFIQSYLKSPTLPVTDIWYAPAPINYYSFGQFYHAILLQLWQLDLSYGYNLLLVALFGIFCIQLFSIAFNLKQNFLIHTKKPIFARSVAAGFLTVFLVALGANGHTLWYLFKNHNFAAYWYPDATRFIERTIHEFPAYSFVVSDLHAHVLSLPINILIFLLIFMWLMELTLLAKTSLAWSRVSHKPLVIAGLIGASLGVLTMTNTWDILIHGALLCLVSLLLLIRERRFFPYLVYSALLVAAGTGLLSALWWSSFTPIATGLAMAAERTPFWQLIVLWLPHLLWVAALLFLFRSVIFVHSKKINAISILIPAVSILVLFLIIFPELFYFKDIYTTYPRANTMFKLVFQGFLFLGLLVALCISSLQWRRHWLLIMLAGGFLYVSSLVYPYVAYRSYYGDWRNYQGLYGLSWFERKYPEDFLIVQYLLAQESKQVHIVEAVGESYSEFGRIASFSGMPTILGWRVHEWLWRAGWDGPGRRTGEVAHIYEQPQSALTQSYLREYQIKYIVVGSKEREAYKNLDLEGVLALGEVVFADNEHYLVRIPTLVK